nr:monodehydroascorbate reductase [Tanacetum cinerariifolium]
MDILKNTNFFRAFTASSIIPSIYIQQLWDTVRYDKITGCYECQLDEQWFDLTKDTLKDALLITPVDNNNAFSSPQTPYALINFVNNLDTMADVNVNALAGQAPTMAPLVCTDDQILPHIRWVPIGKSNCYLDVEKSQSNPIYNIAIDILKHTNFFRAFTTSSTIPSIYIQQDALQITPVNENQAFTSPPSSDALINFVNELGYPKLVRNLSNVITNDMFQPWRALTTIINLCLTGKTSRFERPRAHVLQILWGVVTQTHIDYAERIWEEFTQSIHTFIDDKRNLAQHTSWKKKATLIVIPSIRFTKLVIYHLQRKHKFHPRPDSLLHLPNKVPVLGYLKFSAKGIKKEVFGMPIPGSLITADIQEASYYQEYLAKVAKHRRYLAGETGNDPDSPAPKPTKPSRKPKSTVPKAPPRPSVSKPVSSTQTEPKSTPAKTQGKKRKLTTEISDKPSKAIKSRHGFVSKKRKPISTPKSVDESVAKDVPAKEPRVDNEEVDVQRALVESIKSMYDVPGGPLPPVVIREPESENYQPLPEVLRKGKAKVTEEQVAHDLLNLQKPKRKSPTNQYIFQRHTSTPTGSFEHDESSSLYAKLGLIDSEEETKEDMPGADAGGQCEGQAGPDPGAQDEGQAGSNPSEQAESEGHAGPDPGNAEESQPMPSLVVHAGSDREHMDLDVADVSPLPPPEQMDEGFTAMAYLKVQENLKLTVKEQVLLEEPASSSGTLSSLQHLTKDLSFGDLFFSDKPSRADHDKATAKTKVESIVSVMIQQDMSSIPPMTSLIIDLTSRPKSPKVQQQLKATATETTTTTTTSLPPPYQQQQSIAEAMMMKCISKLEHIMANLSQENKKLEQRDLSEADMKEILYQRMWGTDSYKSHEDHMQLYEALEKLMNCDHSKELAKDLAEARKKKKKSRKSPKTPPGSLPHQPPPPSPPAGPSGASGSLGASGSSQASALASNYLPPPEDSLLAQTNDIAMFMDCVDDSILRHNISKPLPLGGPPSQVTIQSDFFFNKDLEYLRYGSKGSRPALSISKMKAAYYPNVGLEQIMPDQIWIEEECKYDIAAMYGISHWWFQIQRFYIDRHTSEGDRNAVRTHMWILSVVRIEVFSMYGYDYMKKIVLRRVDLNEHVIAERDFKYLAVTFRDRYGVQMMMRFNEIHKFSVDMLQQIDEALDYRVKEFKINRMNPSLNTRFWTRKDVDRSNAFMFAVQKRLKTRRIFRNLESFVGRRVRDEDYRLLKRVTPPKMRVAAEYCTGALLHNMIATDT